LQPKDRAIIPLNMKKTLVALALLAGAVSGYSQGQVWVGDYFNTDFQVTIWSPQTNNSSIEIQGNSPSSFGTGQTQTGPDIPPGTQTNYNGMPLGGGSGGAVSTTNFANGNLWSIQLYAGTNANSLTAVPGVIGTMYTTGNAGLWNLNSFATIPGVPGGAAATLEIVAWYNGNGEYTNYAAALAAGVPAGVSTTATVILGDSMGDAPDLTNGITSFSLAISQVIPPSLPLVLNGAQMVGNGVLQFAFTNNPGASFTVLSSTNLSLALSNWTVVGFPTSTVPGQFQYTSQPTTNDSHRFYVVRSP
jgi:hypothetical protein